MSNIKKVLSKSLSYFFSGKYVHLNPLYVFYSRVAQPLKANYKQELLANYAEKYKLSTFVETGTNKGDTIFALKNRFKILHTIELDNQLYKEAVIRFENDPHIEVSHGDSGEILPLILKRINEPTLFWLDGHYSCGLTAKASINTPIMEELSAVLEHKIKNHVITIDDARLFIGRNDYPTLRQVRNLVKKKKPNLKFTVKNDIIRILPN